MPAGVSTKTNLTNSWPQRNPLQALMEFQIASTNVREAWVLSSSTTTPNMSSRVASYLRYLLKANCTYSQILRRRHKWKDREITGGLAPVDAVQLRLQNPYICNLSRPPLVHLEMFSSSSKLYLCRQMTDNTFSRSRLLPLLILRVPHKSQFFSNLSLFAVSFVESTTTAPHASNAFAGMHRGQFLMDRGVRQGCPASGFLFAMAFDPLFRWLQDSIIPSNPAGLDFLQPAQCAYADDVTVAALSFWALMTSLALAFQTVDHIAGLNFESLDKLSGAKWQ